METVNIKINGKDYAVEKGITVLEAARYAGIDIPTLCYLKDINEIGACRVDRGTFVIELCKVCGQNRGGNLNHMYSFAVAELPCRHILLIAKIPSAAAAGMKKTKTCINKRRGGKRSDTGCESSPIRSAQHVYSIKIS